MWRLVMKVELTCLLHLQTMERLLPKLKYFKQGMNQRLFKL
jgi:hypothetical protein